MDDIIIKPMETDSEIEGKAYVHYQSWQESYRGLIDPAYLAGMTLERCTQTAYQWRENILVAKDGERVVGFAGYGKAQDCGEGIGEVFAIYVLSQYYGKQVGYRLMKAAIGMLPDCKEIVVWVLEGNERAIGFYRRFGFCFDGETKEMVLGTPCKVVRMVYRRNC